MLNFKLHLKGGFNPLFDFHIPGYRQFGHIPAYHLFLDSGQRFLQWIFAMSVVTHIIKVKNNNYFHAFQDFEEWFCYRKRVKHAPNITVYLIILPTLSHFTGRV